MPVYTSFVLRVWQVEQHGQLVLRSMLEDVASGERFGFADLNDLLTFLQTRATHPARPLHVNEPVQQARPKTRRRGQDG